MAALKKGGRPPLPRPGTLLLTLLGAALLALGTFHLATTGGTLSYALPLGGTEDVPGRIASLSEKLPGVRTQLGEAVSSAAMAGIVEDASVLVNGDSLPLTVVAAGPGWFDGEPVRVVQGRGLMESELRLGTRTALLSEALAFRMFGAELPEDAVLELGGAAWQVVGTVRWTRGPGDAADHCAWLPLGSLIEESEDGSQDAVVKPAVLLLNARMRSGAGASALFESTARTLFAEGGSFIDLGKEAMRGTIAPRFAALALGFALWFAVLRRMGDAAAAWLGRYRQALKKDYFLRTLPKLIPMVLAFLLGLGLLFGTAWGLLHLSFEPMLTFPEWVPENITSWESVSQVFWNRIGAHAGLVRTGTPALRAVQFWSGLTRWGLYALLCGLAIGRTGRRQEP